LLKKINENKVLELIYELSWFKPAQLDSLLCRMYCEKNSLNISDGVKFRDKKTTFGSFDRSAKQGLAVIKKSMLTLVLALLLGLSTKESILNLVTLAELLRGLSESGDDALKEQTIALLNNYMSDMI